MLAGSYYLFLVLLTTPLCHILRNFYNITFHATWRGGGRRREEEGGGSQYVRGVASKT